MHWCMHMCTIATLSLDFTHTSLSPLLPLSLSLSSSFFHSFSLFLSLMGVGGARGIAIQELRLGIEGERTHTKSINN